MADLKIDGRMKVKTLKENFKKNFGATLRVYKSVTCKGAFADDDATSATSALVTSRKSSLLHSVSVYRLLMQKTLTSQTTTAQSQLLVSNYRNRAGESDRSSA